ncbi:MAG: C25 family peptidase propeptide domain-containing protein, partial [bacterium]
MRLFSAFCVLLLALTAFGTATFAAVQTIPGVASVSQLTTAEQNRDGVQFRVEVGDLSILEVQTKEGVFSRLMLPGFHATKDVGSPELPLLNRLIAIPYGAEYHIEVEAVQTRIIDLADYGVQHLLLPAQPSMPKNADPATFPFEIDRSAYETDKISRDLIRVVPQGRLRAMDLGRVEVAPVEYFPRTNQIRLTESIDFRVVFEGTNKSGGDELMARTASPFFDHLYAYAANSKAYQ